VTLQNDIHRRDKGCSACHVLKKIGFVLAKIDC